MMRLSLDQIKQMQFAAMLFFFLVSGGHSVQFTITNNCLYPIWPATLGTPAASNTGFNLDPGASNTIDVPDNWASGRVWARTHCSSDASGHFSCETGDCGTGQIPCNGLSGAKLVTLVEMTLNGDSNQDTYDISLVDGFNVPVSVAPQGQGCTTLTCSADLNDACPADLQIKDSSNTLISCQSTCTATNQPQYCCTGAYATADTCQRTDYTDMAKQQCPQAYSFAADDASSTFRCTAGSGYTITFCP